LLAARPMAWQHTAVNHDLSIAFPASGQRMLRSTGNSGMSVQKQLRLGKSTKGLSDQGRLEGFNQCRENFNHASRNGPG